jgi:hypothetical protein
VTARKNIQTVFRGFEDFEFLVLRYREPFLKLDENGSQFSWPTILKYKNEKLGTATIGFVTAMFAPVNRAHSKHHFSAPIAHYLVIVSKRTFVFCRIRFCFCRRFHRVLDSV